MSRLFLTDKFNDNMMCTYFGRINRDFVNDINELRDKEFVYSLSSPAIVNELKKRGIQAKLQNPYFTVEKGDIVYYVSTNPKVDFGQRMENNLPEGTGLFIVKYAFDNK